MAFRFPFTNLQELNLDWILSKVKTMSDETKQLKDIAESTLTDVTEATEAANTAAQSINDMTVDSVTLAAGEDASVVKSIVDNHINLEFGIPQGEKGDPGERGANGQNATDAQVQNAVNTWLTDNVDPSTGYVLDRTLTQSDAAAPADLTGDIKESVVRTFSTSSNYSPGQLVRDPSNGWICQFTKYHAAGAWTGSDVVNIVDLNTPVRRLMNDIASSFDDRNAYDVGDYVLYLTTLYRFTTAHAANTPWNSSEVVQVKITDELNDLNQQISFVRDGSYAVSGLEQGTTQNGNPTPSQTRIRTGLYKIKKGYAVSFEAGASISNIAIENYNTIGAFTGENGWLNSGVSVTASSDGFWRFVFKNSTNTNVVPSDYDATTIISTNDNIAHLVEEVGTFEKTKLDADYSKNLCNAYDTDNVRENTYTAYDTGRISLLSDWCSIQFPIEGGKAISTNVSGAHIAFFSAQNDVVNATVPSVLSGYISGSTGVLTGFAVPSNATYAIISVPVSKKSTVQVEYGNEQTSYSPYIKGIEVSKVIGLDYKETVEYDIYADGTGDYANLRDCLESITDSSKLKQYMINIHAGEYDIGQLYDDYTVSGLTIPNYTTLKGVGDKHNVILKAELQAQSTAFALVNMKDVCGIENLTLYAKNCRYTAHDDYQTTRDTDCIRHIKNVIFIGEYCAYGSVYGGGLKGSAVWEFANCEFDATKAAANGTPGNAFSNHNNTDVKTPSFITFRNCRLLNGSTTYKTVRLNSMTTGSTNGTVTVTFEGCKIDGIYLGENDASQYGAGIVYWVNGFGNDDQLGITISNTDGVDYSGNVDLI